MPTKKKCKPETRSAYKKTKLPKIPFLKMRIQNSPSHLTAKFKATKRSLRFAWVPLCAALIILSTASPLLANMSSPSRPGTGIGLPFVSQHASVRHESLKIQPSADLKTCRFDVVYDIFTDTVGLRIPLLFIAHQYQQGMKIWVDGQAVETQQVPGQYFYREHSPASRFWARDSSGLVDLQTFAIEWEPGEPHHYGLSEMHFFEVDLNQGAHQVRVEYTAEVWSYLHEWLKDQRFLYALDPAAHWYAFGALDVTLDASLSPLPLTTNLGPLDSGDLASIAVWHFDSLPDVKTLEVTVEPKPLGNGQTMIDFGMEGFMWLSGGILALLHLLTMWWWRKRNPTKKFSWIWLLGSLVVPFAAMVVFCMSYSWIADAIGPAASHRSSYFFLIFVFYPFAALGYGLITFFIDYFLRRMMKG